MTIRFVMPITAALACTFLIAACDSKTPPTPACVEAARIYGEALDTDQRAPADEKASEIKIRKDALTAIEDRKIKECGE